MSKQNIIIIITTTYYKNGILIDTTTHWTDSQSAYIYLQATEWVQEFVFTLTKEFAAVLTWGVS